MKGEWEGRGHVLSSTRDARPASHLVRQRRDRTIGLIDWPHEFLGNKFPDIRAIWLQVAIGGREVAHLADTVVNVLDAPVLQSGVL